jgi:hypothetical protein
VDPRWIKSRTETVDPNLHIPKTESAEENLTKDLIDTPEPQAMQSRHESEDPRRSIPYNDKDEPHLPNERRENAEPN